jgi:hypothetical protein
MEGLSMKYRKKPVVIEAIQWDGTPSTTKYIQEAFNGFRRITYNPVSNKLVIETLEGLIAANVDDWIIKGVKGEVYPCKPDVFEATYEAAE